MDDIVGLLIDRAFRLATRDFNGDGARLAKEAADEILRLRAENEKLAALSAKLRKKLRSYGRR